ncbi:MAG: hypothetical protein AABX29_03030, partial [Nanoarchaeota archaeon]
RGIKEIAVFLIIVLVVSIVSFSEVFAAQSVSPKNLVVINMQQGQKCGIEVGDEEKLTQLYEREVQSGGNGLLSSFNDVGHKTKDIHLAMNPGFKGIDKATEEAIKTRCGKNVFDLANSISNKPDSFSGQINFEKEELSEFKNFQFEEAKAFKIKGLGELNGKGTIDVFLDGGGQDVEKPMIKLEKGSSFIPDEGSIWGVDTKINKDLKSFGEGEWNIFNDGQVKGKGLLTLKGKTPDDKISFDNFDVVFDQKTGSYEKINHLKLGNDAVFPKGQNYQQIELNNGKFVDLTKTADLSADFGDNGLLKEMKISAVDGKVDGFGYDGIKGLSINEGGAVNLKPVADYPGKTGGQYNLFADKNSNAFWQYDKDNENVKYLLNNNEKDLLVSTNGKELTSASLDNTRSHSFLADGKKVDLVQLTKTPTTGPATTRPAVNTPLDMANGRINLITSGDPKDIGKIKDPAIQFVTKKGETGLIMNDKVTNMDIFGNTKSLVKVQDGVFTVGKDLKGSPLSQIAHIENNGVLKTYNINPQTGQIRNLEDTLVKTEVKKEKLENLFTGKKEIIGGVPSKDVPSKIGSGATEKSGNGLTWLLVIGGVGAIAAYAFSKSGDKDKDKNKEKEVKNK